MKKIMNGAMDQMIVKIIINNNNLILNIYINFFFFLFTAYIAKAAPRWRLRLENYLKPAVDKVRGSFEGWNILLMVDPKKREGFTRLLKAGKGKVTLLKSSIRNIKNKVIKGEKN